MCLNSKSTVAFISYFNEMPRPVIVTYCHLSTMTSLFGGDLVKPFYAYHCQQQLKLKCKKNTRFSLSHVHWSQNLEEKEKGFASCVNNEKYAKWRKI